MSMLDPPRFEVQVHESSRLRLASGADAAIELSVLEEDIIRVLVLPQGDLHGLATRSTALGGDDTSLERHNRRDLSGFALPALALHSDADTLRVETSKIRLSVAFAGGFCTWQIRGAGG